jgi:hypothetical protein
MAISPELKGVLDLRLAHGEISIEEYRSRLAVLGAATATPPRKASPPGDGPDAQPWQPSTLPNHQSSTILAGDGMGSNSHSVAAGTAGQRPQVNSPSAPPAPLPAREEVMGHPEVVQAQVMREARSTWSTIAITLVAIVGVVLGLAGKAIIWLYKDLTGFGIMAVGVAMAFWAFGALGSSDEELPPPADGSAAP